MSDLRRYVGQRIHITKGMRSIARTTATGPTSAPVYHVGDELTLDAETVLMSIGTDGSSWLDKPSDGWAWGPAPDAIKPNAREHARRVLAQAISGNRSERLEASRALLFLTNGEQPW